MATSFWQIDNAKTRTSKLRAFAWNGFASKASAQTVGALLAVGPGVVPDSALLARVDPDGPDFDDAASLDDDASLLVEIEQPAIEGGDSFNLLVSAGAGILLDAGEGACYFRLTATQTVGPFEAAPAGETVELHLFAALRIALEAGGPDTRESLLPQLVSQQSPARDGALLLARFVVDDLGRVVEVEDLRQWHPLRRALRDVARALERLDELESIVGLPYDVEQLGTINDRLALGTGGGGTTSGGGEGDESDLLVVDMLRTEAFLARKFPDFAGVSRAALLHPRWTGHGQTMPDSQTQPDVYGGGTATIDVEGNAIKA